MAQWIEDPQGRPEVEKVTEELKLPVWKANHKGKFRDFWNELWDKIEDYILKLKGDTEKNSKGLNDRLVSAVGKHDGDFPIANAVVGNVYYSELTKKYYKCKVAGPAPMPNGNFIDMSILENLNRLENLQRNWKILWQGNSHEVQFYTTNIAANINFDNIFSLTIVGNTTCTIPGVLLKKLAINQELIIGHDNAVRSDAVFFFKKISNTFGIFGTRGVAEDIHLHGYNALIVEY